TVDTTKAGSYQVTYTVTDADGNTTEKTITVTVIANQGTITPDDYDLSNNHRKITGSYDGDVAKVQVELNGEVLSGNGTLKDGKFEYYIGGHITSTKDQVFVIAYDEKGNQLDKKQVIIKQGQTQGTVTPDGYDLSNNHRKITGSYDGDVAKVQVELNGEVLPGNGTLKDGKFEYYIGGHITSTKDQVFVIAYDKQGKQLDKQQVSVTKSVTEGTVKPNEFSLAKDNKITGSYSGDIAEIDLQVNGTILPGKGSFKDGSFSYYVGKNVTSEKDEVYVIALDKKGQVLDKEKVDLEGTAGTITVDSYNLNTNKITGTFTGDVAYFKVKINDNELSKGGTLSGNKFSYYVGHFIAHADDKVVIIAFDKNNKQLDQKQLTIVAE
ncbi:hypothetical protein UA3_02545, partial [Enterococcus faecium EnGen0263]|uniref:immunoglobulin-like domain-containing protein n=1 Tax=Enterococcus faecium TaxID=1352 RepID=UPI00032E0647